MRSARSSRHVPAAVTAAVAVCVTLAAPRAARADDRQAARQEYAAGQEADRRKDFAGAIPHYLEAYRLAPHPNALYNAAVDYERTGALRDAAIYYGRYLDEAGDDADDRPKVEALIESLRLRPSRVAIRTTPAGAQISIDAAPVGTAPMLRDLPGGPHVIEARQGDRHAQRQITVEFGEPTEVVIGLAEQEGTLSVASNVSGAMVEVDGAPLGATPLTIAVPAGDRKVIVRSDGYATLERTVHVPAEGSAQINAILVRPVGFVEPTPATRAYVFSIDGGEAFAADTPMVHVGFAYRLTGWEITGRVGFYGKARYGYGLQLRRYLMSGTFKPYIGGSAEYGGAGETANAVYLLGGHVGASFELARSPKMVIELGVEGGAAVASSDGKRGMAFPVLASVIFHGG